MGVLDALVEISGIYIGGEAGADFGSFLDDPDAYFGLEIFDPGNALDYVLTGGDLPPFQQAVLDFTNDPSLSGLVGLVPGVGVTAQSWLNVADNLIPGIPGWVTGGTNPNPDPSVVPMTPTVTQTPPKKQCQCCCRCVHKK